MDMFTDKYISEFVSGLFMLTWRLPYSVPDKAQKEAEKADK